MTLLATANPMDLSFGSTEQVNQSLSKIKLETDTIYSHLNNIRVRYRGSSAPENPEAGQLWEDTVNAVVKKWNGFTWVVDVVSALSLTNRNTVLQGQVSSTGALELIAGSSSSLTADLIATTETIIAVPAGHDVNVGNIDYIVSFNSTQTGFWTQLPANTTSYLFVDYAAGVVTGTYTVILPVFQNYAPAHASGKHWYDTNKEQWYVSDGSSWVAKYKVYVGNVVTDGTKVTATTVEKYNAIYDATKMPLAGGTMTGQLKFAKGNAIASSATVDLTTATGNIVHITGSATITAFTIAAGQIIDVIFDAAPLLTHSSAIVCPTAANIRAVAGDRCRIIGDSSNVAYVFAYQRADGTALVGGVLAGQVIQAIQVGKADIFSTTSTDDVVVTGLSTAITPASTSNKVLVTAVVQFTGSSVDDNISVKIYRGSTKIGAGTSASTEVNNAGSLQRRIHSNGTNCAVIVFLDSPSTASATTYSVKVAVGSGSTLYVNRSVSNADTSGYSSLTLMEVKG